ncbi:hypothetical protein PRZ48_012338 [Zasmidium cellare]|uniref:Uncharacterized protein n=1 Tax=Zasmidium cellare TaxID=395010 RepID=A0ABR0E513_ZASCE|nr:hypothetical protein PRZ48_012338 [Zasmidium cellare]
MDSSNGLVQPDYPEGVDAPSTSTMTRKAPTSSTPPLSSLNAGPSCPSLHFPRDNAMKRKRPQPPAGDSNHYHSDHTRTRKTTRQHNDGTMSRFKRKKTNVPTPGDESATASSSSSMPVDDLPTKSSKRPKTTVIAPSNTTSLPSSSTWPDRSENISLGKKSKQAEQQDTTPGPSSTYTRSPTPSIEFYVPDPQSYIDSQDDDLEDTTFELAPATPEEQSTVSERKVEDLTADVEHLNKLLRSTSDILSITNEELWRQQDENESLKHDYYRFSMDYMLERVMAQKEAKKELEAERARRTRANASHQSHVDSLMEMHNRDMDAQRAKHKVELFEAHAAAAANKAHAHMLQHKLNNSVITVSGLEAEVNNGRYLLNAAEEDLQEMAAIKMKEMTAEENRGLPPAYGSLDDEEVLPPWDRHQDQGTLQVALLKHTTREKFKKIIQSVTQHVNSQHRSANENVRNAAGSLLLSMLSQGLAKVCSHMKEVLTCPEGDLKTDRAFYADRVVKLIMEFCWQVIAAFEIRPITVNVADPAARTRIDISWRDVDNTLTEAIELAFRDNYPRTSAGDGAEAHCPQCKSAACSGFCVRLNELQTLLEQLKGLRSRLEDISSSYRFRMLSRACTWLATTLETDLVFAASASPARLRSENVLMAST